MDLVNISANRTEPCPDPLRVLVVDDHRVFAQVLSFALSAEPGMECVGTAANGTEAVVMAEKLQPSRIVMDISMPDLDGLAATRAVRKIAPNAVIVVATGHCSMDWVVRATEAGASAFVSKYGSLVELLQVIRDARLGGMLIAPSTFTCEATTATARPTLTPREREVLSYLGRGAAPKVIARTLGISVNTCRTYVKSLQEKLGANSALEVVVNAQRLSLLEVGEWRPPRGSVRGRAVPPASAFDRRDRPHGEGLQPPA